MYGKANADGSVIVIQEPVNNTLGGPLTRVRQGVTIADLWNKQFDAICISGIFRTRGGRFVALYAKVLEMTEVVDDHPVTGCVRATDFSNGWRFPFVPMPAGYTPGNTYQAVVWGWFDPTPGDSSSSSSASRRPLICEPAVCEFKPAPAGNITECEAASSSSSSAGIFVPPDSEKYCGMSHEDSEHLSRALAEMAIENQILKQELSKWRSFGRA